LSTFGEMLTRVRYRWLPDHMVGELLAKQWMDNAIPFAALVAVGIFAYVAVPGFFDIAALPDLGRQFAEFGLVVLGSAIVVLSGGIDLSVGSVYALAVLISLIGLDVEGWPAWLVAMATVALGVICGGLNGLLIGYLRLRAFLTTLVALIIFRSAYEIIFLHYGISIVGNSPNSTLIELLATGDVFGIPISLFAALLIYAAWHLVLSRMRQGWRLTAVGGARRSAYNAGVNVQWTVCTAYIWSSVLTSLAGFMNAARLNSAGSDTGVGLEVTALTAVVLGGISLGGGRGSVPKALMGGLFVLILINVLIALAVSGPMSSTLLGVILLSAVFFDVRWLKNRHKLVHKIYVSPTYLALAKPIANVTDPASPFALNDKLRSVSAIGLGKLEGPEDIILDRQDNLYCGSRHGDVYRFFAPDYTRCEVYAHIGGHPLGLAFDKDENLVVCVCGMGLYKITASREIERLTDETNRNILSVADDSAMRFADDLDIAPDGRIFFSEGTTRYDVSQWGIDGLESRGNGRVICYDPRTGKTRTVLRNLVFANGICLHPDGQSLLFAETWACRVSRYWFAGPREGTVELVLDGLPGYPDNINRSSDGKFWLAVAGMRSPVLDLAMRMPAFRRRMARQCAPDAWMVPNLNRGFVVKFTDAGEILESLWDLNGKNHPMITSVREHKGVLYLGGVHNNRIGAYRIPGADPNWCALDSYRWTA
jgi:ribose transport system permease protein